MNPITNTLPALNVPFASKGTGGRFSGLSYTCTSYNEDELKAAFAKGDYIFGNADTLNKLQPFQATITSGSTTYTGRFLFGYIAQDINRSALYEDAIERWENRDKMQMLLVRCPETPEAYVKMVSDLAYGRFTGEMVHLSYVENLKLACAEDTEWAARCESLGMYDKTEMGKMLTKTLSILASA